jgi:hypothetical protein
MRASKRWMLMNRIHYYFWDIIEVIEVYNACIVPKLYFRTIFTQSTTTVDFVQFEVRYTFYKMQFIIALNKNALFPFIII